MFKASFSFDGRIRRTEYGLTAIIVFTVSFIANLLIFLMRDAGIIIWIFFYIPLCWFCLAQGTKRCHDLGNSGWFQLIPFYVLWMLFQDGEPGENSYGPNPKGIGNEDSYDDQINEIGKSLES